MEVSPSDILDPAVIELIMSRTEGLPRNMTRIAIAALIKFMDANDMALTVRIRN